MDGTVLTAPPVVTGVERGKTKTLHFVRHAQATHNLASLTEGRSAFAKWDFEDARLTEFGVSQCIELATAANLLKDEVQLVIVSPLTRAIETALLGFASVKDTVPWISLACLRERSGHNPCDRRRRLSVLKAEYPAIDFSDISTEDDVHWDTLGDARETDEMMVARAHELFAWLRTRPETNIAVITHSSFLQVMLSKAIQASPTLNKWFENCDMRTALVQL